MNARLIDYLEELSAQGRHCFTLDEVSAAMPISRAAIWQSISRLKQKRKLAAVGRGFYLIIPASYKSLGCLPAGDFIDELMAYHQQNYYVGLLSAAEYYGAAHHRPQQFQVMVEQYRRPLICGEVQIRFVVKQGLRSANIQTLNTQYGEMQIASPEQTAFDLIQYVKLAGGLHNVLSVLTELAEQINLYKFNLLSREQPLVYLQRLAYLLAFANTPDTKPLANSLFEYLDKQTLIWQVLEPANLSQQGEKHSQTRLIINEVLEAEL